jgi:surfeit locus 1 family protein
VVFPRQSSSLSQTTRLKLRFRCSLRLVPLLAALAFMALAVSIGNVQRGRAEQKQMAFDRIESARQRAPIQVGALPVDAALLDQQPAIVRGHWMAEKSILIDNKVHNGIAGFHVITPLRIEGARIGILVNRGWIAAPRLRSELPVLPAVEEQVVEVKGIARIPLARPFELAPDHGEGLIWQNLSLARFRIRSGLELQPVILLQTDTADDGFVRDWLPADSGALKHWGFALVWYLAAAAAAIAAVIFSVERGSHEA